MTLPKMLHSHFKNNFGVTFGDQDQSQSQIRSGLSLAGGYAGGWLGSPGGMGGSGRVAEEPTAWSKKWYSGDSRCRMQNYQKLFFFHTPEEA